MNPFVDRACEPTGPRDQRRSRARAEPGSNRAKRTTRACCSSLALVCALGARATAQPASPPSQGEGQLGAPVSWIAVPGAAGRYYMAQRTRDGRLLLTPNESFFPRGGLVGAGDGSVPDVEDLNRGKSFSHIAEWDEDDAAEWGIFVERPGEIRVRVWMTAATTGGEFTLRIGSSETSFASKASRTDVVVVAESALALDTAGRHLARLTCRRGAPELALHWIEITGAAAERAAVLRKRWRPAAAHTRFSSSAAPAAVRLWVMEMDAVPGALGFYSPITTPFGYYGPSWRADGTVDSSFNFSLWSFGRRAEAPPLEQLSHLLAVGDRSARFGAFDHEGTGVKVRGWEPLAGGREQRQVLALRVRPGEPYDTYYSYFYDARAQRWRLFGVGNKFNGGEPLRSLWVGSFVEVPGPPRRQRTGPYERVMRYRGWVMDADGKWFLIDRMTNGNVNRETGLTHTDRGVDEQGWFYLQTGGWMFRRASRARFVERDPGAPAPEVGYLDSEDVEALTSVPSEITAPVVTRVDTGLRGTFSVRNVADDARVTLYWGASEALTFADRWQHEVRLDTPQEGENEFAVEGDFAGRRIFVRLLLDNGNGRYWTDETVVVQ